MPESVTARAPEADTPQVTPPRETPRVEAEIERIERDLGDGPPCISDAAIDVAVRLLLVAFARALERELADKNEELHNWRNWCVIEVAVRNPNVAEFMRHWESRAESAEAETARLRERLERAERDAVERAAKECEAIRDGEVMSKHVATASCMAARRAAEKCADAIRALRIQPAEKIE